MLLEKKKTLIFIFSDVFHKQPLIYVKKQPRDQQSFLKIKSTSFALILDEILIECASSCNLDS